MSTNTFNYFKNKEELAHRAMIHNQNMETLFSGYIDTVARESIINSPEDITIQSFQCLPEAIQAASTPKLIPNPLIYVMPFTTVDAIFNISKQYQSDICTLNFASYKHPGGMFLQGSSAQEESLCHESILYNVLKRFPAYYTTNRRTPNKQLYTNRSIYTPNVLFVRGHDYVCSDVITCAAPNWSAAQKESGVDKFVNSAELMNRLIFVLDVANFNMCVFHGESWSGSRVLILGAFGCGVFGQDAKEVARKFRDLICAKNRWNVFDKIIFAIPKGKNFDDFYNTFCKFQIGDGFNEYEDGIRVWELRKYIEAGF